MTMQPTKPYRSIKRFWNDALTVATAVREIEEREGYSNLADCSEKLAKRGLYVGKTLLSLQRFAVDKLAALDAAADTLTMMAVRDILQPGYQLRARFARKAQIADFDQSIWIPVVTTFGMQQGVVNTSRAWNQLLVAVDWKLAEQLAIPLERIEEMLRILKHESAVTWEQIQRPSTASLRGNE